MFYSQYMFTLSCPCYSVHVPFQHALYNYSCYCLVQLIMKRKEGRAVYCLEVSGEIVSSTVTATAYTDLPRFIIIIIIIIIAYFN